MASTKPGLVTYGRKPRYNSLKNGRHFQSETVINDAFVSRFGEIGFGFFGFETGLLKKERQAPIYVRGSE